MALRINDLKPAKGSKKKRKRVGRGNSSGHGTYSTRGMKGQRSRSGGKKGLKAKGIKNIIQNIPKKKGFKSMHPKKSVINLSDLERHYGDKAEITPKVLLKSGLIANIKVGVKILGKGEITKAFNINGCDVSKSAVKAIKKAGGMIAKKAAKKKKNVRRVPVGDAGEKKKK